MSYSQQPGRPPVPAPGQLVPPQYGAVRPQTGGVAPQRGGVAPQRGGLAPQRGGIPPISSPYVHAPTLPQFWRSDVRRTRVDGRRVRWPGTVAFFAGLAALILLITAFTAASVVLASVALAFSVAGVFFALIALIAGLGRGLGFFGLLLALAGNVYLVAPLLGRG